MPEMNITIRQFKKSDIPKKVEWINNPENNQFLHYNLPLSEEGTEKWFDSHQNDVTRYDAVIEVNRSAVGTIGLLNIDSNNKKAEYYISMGEVIFKGKGVAKEASLLLLEYGFKTLKLNRIYLYTEVDNIRAQKLFESIGFTREGLLKEDLLSRGKFVDRLEYGFLKEDWRTIYE